MALARSRRKALRQPGLSGSTHVSSCHQYIPGTCHLTLPPEAQKAKQTAGRHRASQPRIQYLSSHGPGAWDPTLGKLQSLLGLDFLVCKM